MYDFDLFNINKINNDRSYLYNGFYIINSALDQ